MATANVEHTIKAPIEQVFAVISDHANYQQFSGFSQSGLSTSGTTNPNGLGAVRQLTIFGTRFSEEINHFDPPYRLDYRVIESYFSVLGRTMPLRTPITRHQGRIDLKETNDGTLVTWASQYGIDLPFGNNIAELMRPVVEKAFKKMLLEIDEKLSATSNPGLTQA
jgi:carbon monoxide dehydrogenase subunit G